MATKIRLQRHGKKGYAFFHIVAADTRAKRDGRFIEKLGTYNPNTNPATIDIDFDRTLHWVQVGAEMTDTARAILSYKGVLYKNHLLRGVQKGAFTEADADKKFEAWLKDKEDKITKKADGHVALKEKVKADRIAAEKAKNEARAKELEAANAPDEEVVEAPAEEPEAEVAPVEEAPAEEPKAEETPVEEAPAEEPKAEEAPVEEAPAEEPKAEEAAVEEAPVEEPKAEEKPEEEKKADEE